MDKNTLTNIYDTSNLPVSSADFESIKQDLINFYKDTDEFKDYNFEASHMSQQMNLLAYVTLYNQQYSNTALFESFLRTAQTREAVVQNAQDKGYIPSSVSCTKDKINFIATTNGDTDPISILIPSNTSFVGTLEGLDDFNFITWEDTTIEFDATTGTYHSYLDIIQGNKAVQYFTYDSITDIILYDTDIDRDYMNVYVTDNVGNTTAQYTNWSSKSALSVDPSAPVFYVNETTDGFTRIYFGAGVQDATDPTTYNYIGGLSPSVGSSIKVEYIKTQGASANGTTAYEFNGSLLNVIVESVTSNPLNDSLWNGSYGGGAAESTEHIRNTASIYQETQQRCVTQYDYEAFVRLQFASYVQAISAYGTSDKPGYVFLAIKPVDALILTELQQQEIISFLQPYNILTITPVIVEPDYLYINHYINANYVASSVPQGTAFLKNQIIDSIDTYYTDKVESFGGAFHTSKSLQYIDSSNSAILGSNINISLIFEVPGVYLTNTPQNGVSFMNPLLDIWSKSTIEFKNDSNDDTPTNFNMFSIDSDIVVGPFNVNDITNGSTPYASGSYVLTRINDLGKQYTETLIINDSEDLYYSIGEIDKNTGTLIYDFNNIGISNNIYTADLVLEGAPVRTNIYSSNGGLIVFEPKLRPDYITITLEQIDNA